MSRSPGAYSWLPGFLRKFLNLDDDLPDYGPSSYRAPSSPAPSSPASFSQSPRPAPSFTRTDQPRFTPSYTPPEPQPQRFAPGPPPPAARTTPSAAQVAMAPDPTNAPPQSAPVTPGATLPGGVADGSVQPIGYLFRAYARGALPPQGLEQFTRETRATLTDVVKFYSYWTRFQTDELVRLGRELYEIVFDDQPARADTSSSAGSIRRIKVTTANGDEKPLDRVATTTLIDPPPVPTPAAPPTPPATTAVFSPSVTADDAQIPPGGRADLGASFGAGAAAAATRDALAAAAQQASAAAGDSASAADATRQAVKDATDSAKKRSDDQQGKA